MSQPAQVTTDADWRTVVDAIEETVLDIRDLREDFADAVDRYRQEQDMTDPNYDDRRRDERGHPGRRRKRESWLEDLFDF